MPSEKLFGKKGRKLAVVDLETDPQDYQGEYLPFVAGFYDGVEYRHFWDQPGTFGTCLKDLFAYLQSLDQSCLIYAHNGGKFDFMMMLEYMQEKLMIQNGRIVKCFVSHGKERYHEFRDSYSIIPVPLADFKGKSEKKKFKSREEQTAYYLSKFNRKDRLKHKDEIVEYLRDDCLTLYEGVTRFRDEFGDRLTIGGTSMKELRKIHEFENIAKQDDTYFRNFYFGGRNQCFATGSIQGEFKIFDVNSMYPFVMSNFQHPISRAYEVNININKRTTFAFIDAINEGCLPVRTKTGLDFTCEKGQFFASIHEIEAGLETKTLRILKVKHTIEHKQTTTFASFVDHFYRKRQEARAQGSEMLSTFYKLILNSAYGKFAQNPENYREYIITHDEIPADVCQPHCPPDCPYHWKIDQRHGQYIIWSRPSNVRTYYNVATAASITSAARALLLRGLANAVDPLYCDTDSIICRDLNCQISDKELGAWKIEGKGSFVGIAGKKLYCVYDHDKPVKHASKGIPLTAEQVRKVCLGETLEMTSPVPHFKLDGTHAFVTRRIKATAVQKTVDQGRAQFSEKTRI